MTKRGNGEGSIYQDSRGVWRASVSLEGGKRKYLSGRTRADVARKLASALRDVQHGLPLPGERLTLQAYLADWLENTIKPGRRDGTYLLYASAVRLHIGPAIGKVPLAKVGPQHVQKLQAELLAKNLGIKRIRLVRAALSAALAQGVKWNLIVRNPVTLVDPPRAEEHEPRPLTLAQATALLAAARGHEFEQLYTVMLATGLIVAYAYILEIFGAWYSGDPYEMAAFGHRLTGPYSTQYWTLVACNIVAPNFLWRRHINTGKNDAVIALYPQVSVGTPVYIGN